MALNLSCFQNLKCKLPIKLDFDVGVKLIVRIMAEYHGMLVWNLYGSTCANRVTYSMYLILV